MNKTGQKTTKKQSKSQVNFQLTNPNAAGIDIGDTLHAVAVPQGRDEVVVKEFGTFTSDLLAIVDWLKACRIDTVAMESTGIYWKNFCAVLTSEGFDVYLVNARHTKNISVKRQMKVMRSGYKSCIAADCLEALFCRMIRLSVCGRWSAIVES